MTVEYGTGVGTPIAASPPGAGACAPHSILPDGVQLGVSLDRYQELIRLPEAAFNGIMRASDADCYECAAIWKQSDRDGLAIGLAQAEQMREAELGYFVAPKYIADEEQEYKFPIVLNMKMLIGIGTSNIDDIRLNVPLSLSAGGVIYDPVVINVATIVTDPNEICVFYHGYNVQIHPSSVTISGGIVTIKIPRSRLLNPCVDTNCDPPPEYDDDNNFLTTVDVKRCYLDPSDGAYMVCKSGCDPCSSTDQLLYTRIVDHRTSIVKYHPATYANGVSTCIDISCCTPSYLRISYLSGRVSSMSTEMDTIRLAHTLLPSITPYSADICKGCWIGDRDIVKGAEFTPYGIMLGATTVWLRDSRAKVGYGAKAPGMRR
jgi:hypothetical protein